MGALFLYVCTCVALLPGRCFASRIVGTASRGPVPTLPPGFSWTLNPSVVPADVFTMWTDTGDGLFYAGHSGLGSLYIGNASEASFAVPREPLQHWPYQCSLMATASSGFACALGSRVCLYNWAALSSKAAPVLVWTATLEKNENVTAVNFIHDNALAVAVGGKVQLLNLNLNLNVNVNVNVVSSSSSSSSSSSPTVFQEFTIGSSVNSLVLLPGVGLVVGSSASVQLFNSSSLQPKGPAEPCMTLLAYSTNESWITSLVAMDHWGLAVGKVDGILLFNISNISSFQPGKPIEPYQVLNWGGTLSADMLLAFSSAGVLAAGQGYLFAFFAADRLRPHGPTTPSREINKNLPGGVTSMAPLSNGWIASGGMEGVVYLFDPVGREDGVIVPGIALEVADIGSSGLVAVTGSGLFLYNTSTFQEESTKPFQELSAGDDAVALSACLLNDSHELAVVFSGEITSHFLYREASLQRNGPTEPSGQFDNEGEDDPVEVVWGLRSGLAGITGRGAIELYNSSGAKVQRLGSGNVSLLLQIEDQLMAAQDSAVYIFGPSSLLPAGPTVAVQKLEVCGSISSMAATLSGGLAVAAVCEADTANIFLFEPSSLLPEGVSRPYQSLEVGGIVDALAASMSGGLMATAGGTLYFFNGSSMAPGGPRMPFASMLQGAAGTALGKGRGQGVAERSVGVSSTFFVHKTANGFPNWFHGRDVLQPVRCPSLTFKLNDAECRACPPHLLSFAGSDQCDVLPVRVVAYALLSSAALLTTMAGSALLALQCLPRRRRSWWGVVMRGLAWLLGCAALATSRDRLDVYWWWAGLVLLTSRGLLAIPSNEKMMLAVIADLSTLGLLMVLVSMIAVQLTEDAPSPSWTVGMWTPLGRARRKMQQGIAALVFIPPSIEMVWAWAAVQGSAAPELHAPTDLAQEALREHLAEPQSAATPHLSLDLAPLQDGRTVHAGCWTCSAWRRGQWLGRWLNGTRLMVLAGRLGRFACSWEGRHLASLVNGLASLWTLGTKLAMRQLAMAAAGTLVSAVVLSGLVVSLSLLTILWARRTGSRAWDPHFRRGLLLKGLLMVSKSALLAMPEAFERVDVAYGWSCIQGLCPDWCTERAGRCMAQDNGHSCSCETTWPSKAVLALTIGTCFLMGALTILDLFYLLRNTGVMTRHVVAATLCNLAQLSGLVLVFLLPMTALSEQPGIAAVFAASLVPLSLALNEFKWIRQPADDIPKIEVHESGLHVYVALFVPLAVASLVFLHDHTAAQLSQPAYAAPTFRRNCWLLYFSALVLAIGVLGSLLLLCQQPLLHASAHSSRTAPVRRLS